MHSCASTVGGHVAKQSLNFLKDRVNKTLHKHCHSRFAWYTKQMECKLIIVKRPDTKVDWPFIALSI